MSDHNARPGVGLRHFRNSIALPLVAALALVAGCSDSQDGSGTTPVTPPPPNDYVNAAVAGPVANIRRTTGGVPHIKADNLESIAFGAGYVQAQDNLCLIADAIVKVRGERARYFGPGPGDIHVITDFSYKAQKLRSGAPAEYATLSAEARAMLRGFAAGYNKYVRETPPGNRPAECRSAPWVFEITVDDLLAHYRGVAAIASGEIFATGGLFLAVPPGVNPVPSPAAAVAANGLADRAFTDIARHARANVARQDFGDLGLASNAWGIGGDLSENGKGALLANPHFPYTGTRRFYEMQVTIPGYLNFHGAGLTASPIPQIGFNQNLGWSHTVSTSRRFTMYELKLKPGDNLTYIKDGVEKPITSELLTVQVNTGSPTLLTLQRRFYYSEYGPMLAADAVTSGGLPAWGVAGTAYTYRDANGDTRGFLDTWLKMSRATTLEQFRDVFRSCGSTLWVNSTYADDQGNAYYIDSSSVPNLSATAIAVLRAKYQASPAFRQLFDGGLTLLDGSTSRDDWVTGTCRGLVPYEGHPQLVRRDFVQNSSDSYWATNPAAPIEGISPLFGAERTAQGPRTRIGLTMLQNPTQRGFAAEAPGGQDGKFGATDLARVLHNNRTWYAEQFLADLRSRCALIGAGLVNLPGGVTRTVDTGCNVLRTWNGTYDLSSVGAHVYRVFITDYRGKFAAHLTKPFDPADPVGTPSAPAPVDPANLDDDPMLVSLAAGLQRLDQGGIRYDAPFGTVQYVQPSGGVPPGGTPVTLGTSVPWHGGDGTFDGAFNAVTTINSTVQQDTRLPRINPATIGTTAGLSSKPGEGWLIAYGTSWHFGLEFTPSGPRALGLLSYSRSTDAASPFFNDQMRRYSDKNMRSIPFTESEISSQMLPGGEMTLRLF